jgi:hypothetical protein
VTYDDWHDPYFVMLRLLKTDFFSSSLKFARGKSMTHNETDATFRLAVRS